MLLNAAECSLCNVQNQDSEQWWEHGWQSLAREMSGRMKQSKDLCLSSQQRSF